MTDEQLQALEDLTGRFERAAESIAYSARAIQEAASTVSNASSGMREAAGTMAMASRR